MSIGGNKETTNVWLLNGFIIFLIFAFLLSGINREARILFHLAYISALSLGFLHLKVQSKKLDVPPFFLTVLIFTVILHIYWIFSKNYLEPFYWALMFSEGVCLWFIAYNLKTSFSKNLSYVFLIPALFYSLIFFISMVFGLNLIPIAGIYFQIGTAIHQHIGSLWVVVIVYLMTNLKSNKMRLFRVIIFITGIYFLIYSNSRTAVYAIFAVLLYKNIGVHISKLLKYLFVIGLALIIVVSGINRSLIFSRPYFLQSIIGFYQHPYGVGMGNFKDISSGFVEAGGPLALYSEYTHNLLLESIVGVGIFSLPFIYAIFLILYSLYFRKKNKGNLGFKYIFLVLTFIFMFDLTYAIPGMFMLWFLSLGVAQKEDSLTV